MSRKEKEEEEEEKEEGKGGERGLKEGGAEGKEEKVTPVGGWEEENNQNVESNNRIRGNREKSIGKSREE